MKHCFVFCFFIIVATSSNGQRKHKAPVAYQDTLSVRLSPMGLIDIFDGNFTPGISYAFNARWTISADISGIFYSSYLPQNTHALGYIFKPAIRYYLSDSRKVFMESALFYKNVNYKLHDWIDRDVVNGVPAYREEAVFHFRKQVVGLNMQGGFQKGLSRDNLLRIEIFAGIGIRYKRQDLKNLPGAKYTPDNFFFGETIYGSSEFSFGVPHGLRLVYVIK